MAHRLILLLESSGGSRFIDQALLNDPDLKRDLDQIFDLELVLGDDPRAGNEAVEASLSTQATLLVFKAVVSRDGRSFEEPRKLSRPLDSMARAQAFLPQARLAVIDAVGASLGAERKPTKQVWLSNPAALIHRASGPKEDYELTSKIVAELGNGAALNVDPGFAHQLFDGRRIADLSGPTSVVVELSIPADGRSEDGAITATHVDTGIRRYITLRRFPASAERVLSDIQRLVEGLRDDVAAKSQAGSSQSDDADAVDTPSSDESARITERSDTAYSSQEAGRERSISEGSGQASDVDAAIDVASSAHDVLGAPPLREMLSLGLNPEPSHQQNATFQARIETLLGVANRFIDDGHLDHDPYLRDLVERDRNFLRAEAFETDEPFALGDAVGAIVARLERNLLSVAKVPDTVSPLLDDLIDATSADSPDRLPDILDGLIGTARLDDPEWLASQDGFDAYASDIHDIAEHGARRWLMNVSGWWRTEAAEEMRHDTGWGATVGAPVGAAIGLVVSAVTAASLGIAATVGGIVGAIVGLSLAWFFGRYRNFDESSED